MSTILLPETIKIFVFVIIFNIKYKIKWLINSNHQTKPNRIHNTDKIYFVCFEPSHLT